MVGVTGAILGAAVIGAGSSIISGNKAAKAQKQAAQMAEDTERYIYDTTRADYAPYREVGYGALGQLASLYGVPRVGASGTGTQAPGTVGYLYEGLDGARGMPAGEAGASPGSATTPQYGGFTATPGYQFRVDEAMKAIERSAAARGGLRSGATMDALQRRVQGVASDEFNRYADRLAQLAGVGQSATGSTAQAGAQFADGVSRSAYATGNARASAYANTGNAINGAVQNVTAAYLYGQGYGGGGFGGPVRTPGFGG